MQGEVKEGRHFLCGAQPSAYAQQPWETVNYADCHDGQTLFDQVPTQLLLLLMLLLLVVMLARFCQQIHVDCMEAVIVLLLPMLRLLVVMLARFCQQYMY